MNQNLVGIKQTAKDIIRQAAPRPWKITLLYLLFTAVIGLITVLLSSPSIRALFDMSERLTQYAVSASVQDMVNIFEQMGALWSRIILLSTLTGLLSTVLSYGFSGYALKLWRKQETGIADLFSGFRLVLRIIAAMFFMGLFAFLWVLLALVGVFIVALFAAFLLSGASGVVVTILIVLGFYVFIFWVLLRYAMAAYWIISDPNCGALEAISRSKKCLRGYKGKLIGLGLSFIGWYALMLAIFLISIGVVSAMDLVWGLSDTSTAVMQAVLGAVFALPLNLKLLPYTNVTFMGFFDIIAHQNPPGGAPYTGPLGYSTVDPVLSSEQQPPQPPQQPTDSTYTPKPPQEPGLSGSNDPWKLD